LGCDYLESRGAGDEKTGKKTTRELQKLKIPSVECCSREGSKDIECEKKCSIYRGTVSGNQYTPGPVGLRSGKKGNLGRGVMSGMGRKNVPGPQWVRDRVEKEGGKPDAGGDIEKY